MVVIVLVFILIIYILFFMKKIYPAVSSCRIFQTISGELFVAFGGNF